MTGSGGADHEILPQPGTARTASGGVATLTDPLDYPVTAVCQCGREIRCEQWLRARGSTREVRADG